jgi:hypothetical protein
MRIEEVKGVLAAVGLQTPDRAVDREPKRLNRNDE